MKIAVPDFVTNSYFPAVAAVELGFFREEGIDMTLEHIFPVNTACEVMRDGGVDFVLSSSPDRYVYTTPTGTQGPKLSPAIDTLLDYWEIEWELQTASAPTWNA